MYEIRSISDSRKHIENYLSLFSRCFPREKKFNSQYLNWLYFDNPNGSVLGYDAWHEGNVVAHYASIPCLVQCYGKVEPSLLSINSTTHPDHQRKGLFLQLANRTYEEASKRGYKIVFAVANKFATPGRIKNLGFQLISPLSIAIGSSTLNLDWPKLKDNTDFNVLWERKSLQWRLRSPGKQLFTYSNKSYQGFYSEKVFGLFIPYCENYTTKAKIIFENSKKLSPMGIKLFIGLIPQGVVSKKNFLKVPEFLKPSPFNLVFKRLDGTNKTPQKERVFFNFLDFDVF